MKKLLATLCFLLFFLLKLNGMDENNKISLKDCSAFRNRVSFLVRQIREPSHWTPGLSKKTNEYHKLLRLWKPFLHYHINSLDMFLSDQDLYRKEISSVIAEIDDLLYLMGRSEIVKNERARLERLRIKFLVS